MIVIGLVTEATQNRESAVIGTRSSRLASPKERSSTIFPWRAISSRPERSPRSTSGRVNASSARARR